MRVRLKLTTLCDLDLISLYGIPEFDFKGWIRDALRTYAGTGEISRTPLPTAPDKVFQQAVRISLTFDEKKDASVVGWLNILQHKLRSSAIKAVLRCSLTHPCLFSFYSESPAPFLATSPENLVSAGKPAKTTTSAARRKSAKTAPLPAPPLVNEAEDTSEEVSDIFSLKLDDMEYGGE